MEHMELQDLLFKAMDKTAAVKPRPVSIPGWPQLYVRALTVGEVEDRPDRPKESNAPDKNRVICRGVAEVLCNEKGVRVFDANNPAHIEKLAKQPFFLLQKILDEVSQFNGLNNEAVEQLGKNSPSTKSS